MRIAVTGASGNIGTALLRRLAAERPDDEVIGICRRIPEPAAPYDLTWYSIDLAQPDASTHLVDAFEGVDTVVHLAWGFQPTRRPQYLHRLGVGGSRAVLQAADIVGVKHLIHMSSVGTYARAPGHRVDEGFAHTGIASSVYSRDKAEAERRFDAYEQGGRGKVLITRVRPGFVVQRDAGSALLRYGLPGYLPARALRLLPILPLDRSLRLPVVHTDDVAAALVQMVHRRPGGAFNICAEPPLTPADVAQALSTRPVHLPSSILGAAVDLSWRAHVQALDRGWVDLAFSVPLLNCDRARRELDWRPEHDARSAFAEAVQGMVDSAATSSAPLRRRSWGDTVHSLLRSGPVGVRERP